MKFENCESILLKNRQPPQRSLINAQLPSITIGLEIAFQYWAENWNPSDIRLNSTISFRFVSNGWWANFHGLRVETLKPQFIFFSLSLSRFVHTNRWTSAYYYGCLNVFPSILFRFHYQIAKWMYGEEPSAHGVHHTMAMGRPWNLSNTLLLEFKNHNQKLRFPWKMTLFTSHSSHNVTMPQNHCKRLFQK